ncbi:alpha-glucosidase [Haloferula helveola]|uniref:Alpha-glucosidase n=1 Tax=Haloferula helveola TaxID=490095 RepID=A0ABM7R6N0_9BACT|nr:alpha-glucosidase [Haloferula helveola]
MPFLFRPSGSAILPAAIALHLGLGETPALGETLRSPDGRLHLDLELKDGLLCYSLDRDDTPLTNLSKAGIRWHDAAPRWSDLQIETSTHDSRWKPVWGKREEVRDHYSEARATVTLPDDTATPLTVVFRLYDEGLAFRYELADAGGESRSVRLLEDLAEFHFAKDGTCWSYNGENPNKGPEPLGAASGTRRLPLTARLDEKTYVSIAEADLDNFGWLELKAAGGSASFTSSIETTPIELPFRSPWRVLVIGDTPGCLVDADLLENLNPPCAIDDPSWIRPGVTFWDWRTWGYEAPDGFSYGLDMASWKRFIDYASETGVPHLLLDANWYGPEFDPASDPTVSRDHLVKQLPSGEVVREPAPEDWKEPIDVPALITYAKERGVGIFLYINDKARIRYDFEKTLATYREWGAAGIKYGFMKANSRRQKVTKTREIIELCAKYRLMCNFHDGPMPPGGLHRTWPNCMTVEFCHAQADAKKSFSPTTFNTSVFVNMISGPIDMNNGMFGLADAHKARPRVFQPIPSTIVGECARTLIAFSGQAIVLDAPESFAAHPELFSFLTAQKQPWRESETLDGAIGEFIVMRRTASDGTILLGATTNEKGRTVEVPLSFLESGTYSATIFEDKPDTHFETRKESYRSRKAEVRADDTLTLTLAPGGGACVRFTKQ